MGISFMLMSNAFFLYVCRLKPIIYESTFYRYWR